MTLPTFDRPIRCELLGIPGVEDLLPLLQLEHRECEAVLGQAFQVREPSDARSHVWRISREPQISSSTLEADLENKTLLSRIAGPETLGESLNLLHCLAHSPKTRVEYAEVGSYSHVAHRISTEIANTYPYFHLRDLNWERISRTYENIGSLRGVEFWRVAARWIAELGDAHTTLVAPGSTLRPPYRAEMTAAGAVLLSVPEGTAAHRAGARAGSALMVDDPEGWLAAAGASPQHRREVAARRFMAMQSSPRRFRAETAAGRLIEWDEPSPEVAPSVQWTGSTLRIARFDSASPSLLAAALSLHDQSSPLTIDLRGNTGGSLTAADACRRLLLKGSGEYGSVQHSTGRGSLSSHFPLWLEPAGTDAPEQLRILVDSMTYSAAEDFLQPLAGLDYVTITGGPTGGGSGRPRTIPLMDGYLLRVSTAITYTADGAPVEYWGIGTQNR